MPIHFSIAPSTEYAHTFTVTLTLPPSDYHSLTVSQPTWIAGSYLIREFSRHLHDFSIKPLNTAKSTSTSPILTKTAKNRWRIDNSQHGAIVTYHVYAHDLSVRGAWLDNERAFINLVCICLHVEELNSVIDLEIPPFGNPTWQVATNLPAKKIDNRGFGHYQAENYQILIDHPISIAQHDFVSFDVAGTPHRIAVSGTHQGSLPRLADDTKRICAAQIDFFGGQAPFSHYLFLLHLAPNQYGGLEHQNSTALLASPHWLPKKHSDSTHFDDDYLDLLGLISHEYFHAWNVKRIRPTAFDTPNFDHEHYTRLLWAFEGITSYYDDLFLIRAGLINRERYLDRLARTVTQVQRTPGRTRQTLEEASFDTWIKFYRPDENTPNTAVSYYQKGALAALTLDLVIRERSQHQCSLDHVMQHLWQRYLTNPSRGIEEHEWETLAAHITALPLDDIFHRLLRTTEDLPLAHYLAQHHIGLHWRTAQKSDDRGGWQTTTPHDTPSNASLPWIGLRTSVQAHGLRIEHVLINSPAERAQLTAGDVLIAINHHQISDLASLNHHLTVDQAHDLHYFRQNCLHHTTLTPCAAPQDTCVFFPLPPSHSESPACLWPNALPPNIHKFL